VHHLFVKSAICTNLVIINTYLHSLSYGQKLLASGGFNLNGILLVPVTTDENPWTNQVTSNGHFKL